MDKDYEPLEEALSANSDSVVAYDDESVVWQGGPSQWVNFTTFILWGACLIVGIIAPGMTDGIGGEYADLLRTLVDYTSIGLIALSCWLIVYAYLSVKYEYTVITQNKIKEAKGITSIFRQEKFCEISDLKDITSPPAGFLALVGLSTLVIETNDQDQPLIKIRAIKNREDLINKLLPIARKLKIDRKGYFN